MHKVETGFTGSKLLYKCTRYKQINQDTKWKVDIWKMKGQFQLDDTHTHTQRDICASRAASSQLKRHYFLAFLYIFRLENELLSMGGF